jgi:hypothetical protein
MLSLQYEKEISLKGQARAVQNGELLREGGFRRCRRYQSRSE